MPTSRIIQPGSFVPVATDTGLILPLGRWVIEQAVAAAARWPDLEIAANLSAKSGHFEFGRVHISKRIPKPMRDKLKDQLTINNPPHDDVRDSVLLTLEDATKPSMRDWV